MARKFLHFVERYKTYLGVHGGTAEGNPSGGNVYRGLYNIALKSLGAGMKKAPDVRLDGVMDYGERIWADEREEVTPLVQPDAEAAANPRFDTMSYDKRGFFFMDSPGNDLESIAGQVASGCNVLTFTTGNGAITNFPFVPTIKIVTTSNRYKMLTEEMDINAGRFQDGEELADLGREYFAWMVNVCSGLRTKGERLGHSQISIWRTWCVAGARGESKGNDDGEDESALDEPISYPADLFQKTTAAITAKGLLPPVSLLYPLVQVGESPGAARNIALLYPTSLCSSEVAKLTATQVNEAIVSEQAEAQEDNEGGKPKAVDPLQVVALAHTEGCGSMGKLLDENYDNILVGHVTHPMVGAALFLEHGCEKRHNNSVQVRWLRWVICWPFGLFCCSVTDWDRYYFASQSL